VRNHLTKEHKDDLQYTEAIIQGLDLQDELYFPSATKIINTYKKEDGMEEDEVDELMDDVSEEEVEAVRRPLPHKAKHRSGR